MLVYELYRDETRTKEQYILRQLEPEGTPYEGTFYRGCVGFSSLQELAKHVVALYREVGVYAIRFLPSCDMYFAGNLVPQIAQPLTGPEVFEFKECIRLIYIQNVDKESR